MQIDQPKISIVTCSYQQGRYLDATLRSVLDQGYPDLEYIVVDGGSTDESAAVLRAHEHELAYWVSEPDRGQTDALIKGFSRSTGEICGWLCSDDLLLPGALQKVADFFATHPDVAAVYGDALWIDAAGDYIRPKREMGFSRFVFLFDHNYIAQPSMFWRRDLYEGVRGLDREFNLAMDADLWERFSRHTHIAHLPEYLSCMRYYPEQKTRAMRPQGRLEDARIRGRSALARLPGATPVLQRLARLQRVLAKGLAGGYWGNPPEGQLRALERYRIEGGGA
ncbi:MAG TPA: glycosyltransferase family 2 protein [Burkholderiales bacterium]|jgi:glycosyltransferase involved in cell wall biosynthesis|nr:glycosyltransferase family 2 protein [Burkholderiales bacterium]